MSGPITRDESFPAGWEFSALGFSVLESAVLESAVLESAGLDSAGFELAAPEFGVPALPPLVDGAACPLPAPGVRVFPSFEVLPARSGNRLARPRPSATKLSAAPSTGRLDMRLKVRPSFNFC